MLRHVSFALLCAATLSAFGREEKCDGFLDMRKGVFVQEAWKDGKPVYYLASSRSEAVEVRVYDYFKGGLLAGPWKLDPGQVLQVDARPLVGIQLLKWRLGDGSSLGELESPRADDWFSAPRGALVTHHGLNGIDCRGRWLHVWMELPSHPVSPGETVTLKMHVQDRCGKFVWSKERHPKLSVECGTLTIRELHNAIEIDTDTPLKSAEEHAVTIRFHNPIRFHVPAPDRTVEPAGLLVAGCWYWSNRVEIGDRILVGVPLRK